MLKKNLLYIICVAYTTCTHLPAQSSQAEQLPAKIQQLYQLQKSAEILNHIKPIGNYLFAVPAFIELTGQDIQYFLAAIPSGFIDQRSRTKQPISMLQYIQLLWEKVIDQAKQYKKITPLMRDHLIVIREAIETAFQHDLLNGPLRPAIKTFLERQREQNNELILRAAPENPIFAVKSSYPISAEKINAGIIKTLQSYFSEQAILERIDHDRLSQKLDLHIIIQSVIKEDTNTQQLIVSGISCSYDILSNIPHIITIISTFGDAKALCKPTISKDTYFVHDKTIYPIIRKKPNRLIGDPNIMRSLLMPNTEQLQNQSTLNAQAIHELARATQFLEEIYQKPVCLTFVKRDNTIYLLKVHTSEIPSIHAPTFFDPLYTEHITPEKKVAIMPVKPHQTLVVVKKREKIILAPNVRTFVELLNKRKKPEDVTIGIIKTMPAAQSKEAQLLENINIPVIWSPAFEQLRSWIDERTFPLVFDMQQKIAFPFSRCRGFCTLFQAVQNGIYAHPLNPEISVVADFTKPINSSERAMLKPDEHFSGVTLMRLFDLLKTGSQATAESALNTILFRLEKQIAGEYITKKECAISLVPFDMNKCERMEKMYTYIERIAYQLYLQLKRLYGVKTTYTDTLEKMFLINILQAAVMQQPNEQIVESKSFMHVINKE